MNPLFLLEAVGAVGAACVLASHHDVEEETTEPVACAEEGYQCPCVLHVSAE